MDNKKSFSSSNGHQFGRVGNCGQKIFQMLLIFPQQKSWHVSTHKPNPDPIPQKSQPLFYSHKIPKKKEKIRFFSSKDAETFCLEFPECPFSQLLCTNWGKKKLTWASKYSFRFNRRDKFPVFFVGGHKMTNLYDSLRLKEIIKVKNCHRLRDF